MIATMSADVLSVPENLLYMGAYLQTPPGWLEIFTSSSMRESLHVFNV